MFRRLHTFTPFWVSLWLNSLLFLALVPAWSHLVTPVSSEFNLSAGGNGGWDYMPTEWIMEEEDLSPKETTHPPVRTQGAATTDAYPPLQKPLPLPTPAGNPKPVFLAYQNLRL